MSTPDAVLVLQLQSSLAKMEEHLLALELEASQHRVRCQYLELRNRALECALQEQERRVVELMLELDDVSRARSP